MPLPPPGLQKAHGGTRPAVQCYQEARPSRGMSLLFDFDRTLRLDHLAAAVETVGAHVMAQVRLAGGGVGRQLARAQRVVRAAHAAGGLGATRFLDGHGYVSNYCLLSFSFARTPKGFGLFESDSSSSSSC